MCGACHYDFIAERESQLGGNFVNEANNDTPRSDCEAVGYALRKVFPAADYGSDAKTSKAWNECVAEVAHVMERMDPHFDHSAFLSAIGMGSWGDKGVSKRDRRWLLLLAVLIGVPILWMYYRAAVANARATGRGDVWAQLCDEHPRLAERLLPIDKNGIPYLCKDFERKHSAIPVRRRERGRRRFRRDLIAQWGSINPVLVILRGF